MAILNGIIKKMTGSAGQLTLKTVNGQTVVSEKVTLPEGQIEEPKEVKTIDISQFGSCLFCLTCLPAKMLEQTDYTCRNSL